MRCHCCCCCRCLFLSLLTQGDDTTEHNNQDLNEHEESSHDADTPVVTKSQKTNQKTQRAKQTTC